MSLHRLFVPPERIGEVVRLSPEQSRHLETVLRLAPGDEVEVFDGQGARWEASIESRGVLRLGKRGETQRGATDVWLAQGLAKGEKLDLVVQKATELGASRIVPLSSERAVVRQPGAAKLARWRRIAQEASRQCGRADVPPRGRPGAVQLPRQDGRERRSR